MADATTLGAGGNQVYVVTANSSGCEGTGTDQLSVRASDRRSQVAARWIATIDARPDGVQSTSDPNGDGREFGCCGTEVGGRACVRRLSPKMAVDGDESICFVPKVTTRDPHPNQSLMVTGEGEGTAVVRTGLVP